jgi:TRAP-type C4-dicarboxylate transport system permease large subunit
MRQTVGCPIVPAIQILRVPNYHYEEIKALERRLFIWPEVFMLLVSVIALGMALFGVITPPDLASLVIVISSLVAIIYIAILYDRKNNRFRKQRLDSLLQRYDWDGRKYRLVVDT